MIHLNFTREETNLLIQLVETCIADLRVEISNTDNIQYKEMLKERKVVMKKLLEALAQAEDLPLAE